MFRLILVSLILVLPLAAQAGDMALDDLKAKNGVQLTAEDLNRLMPGTKVISYFSGSTRTWTNEPDGKLMAYRDARGSFRKIMNQVTAHGTWHIGKNGTYCVTLDWPKKTEKWCKYIFNVDGKYYGVKSIDSGDAIAHEFEFSK